MKKLDPDYNATDAWDNDQSMSVLTILEKIKETKSKFSQRSVINNDKLSRSESYVNKYTVKQIKTCSKK